MSGHSCSDDCDHSESPELGIQYSLYSKIDTDHVECLNETNEGSGKGIFKAWENRLSQDAIVESDCDEELLFNIPFTGNVKLKGIIVIGGEGGTHPSRMRLYKNKPGLTFDDCTNQPEQEFEMHPDNSGTIEYATRVVKFSSVHHLSIHFPSNFGSPCTKIIYIGLKGEFTPAARQEILITNYEARPNPADHKMKNDQAVGRQVM